jgi:hypothetical protein
VRVLEDCDLVIENGRASLQEPVAVVVANFGTALASLASVEE